MLKQLMICMHTANVGFLILDTLLNSIVSNLKYIQENARNWQKQMTLVLVSAVPLVSNGIFCAMELSLHCLPMDHPRMWFINLVSKHRPSTILHSSLTRIYFNQLHSTLRWPYPFLELDRPWAPLW